ncbi:hypothetical protein NGB24_08780 [Mammaliicoccus vitulinus]|uniref:hypothetical protein n=1 Tax=Mammaliicoccus vitulinus TaxID=71237 RepID=UPI002DB81ADC|nr:hypothetical protein [Mammaliicoccus vitulinus]MEB7657955.1 hypothetical protein [Mammaliicoccus vitulinus]
MRILLLNQKPNSKGENFHPKKFENIVNRTISINDDSLKVFEHELLDKINNYNPKLKVDTLKYTDIKSMFKQFEQSINGGLIVREVEYIEGMNIDSETFMFTKNEKKILWIIDGYVFTTLTTYEKSRNSFYAQLIFPSLITYMERFLDAPMYNILNHPIYILDICNKQISANSVLKNFADVIIMGVEYIEIFPDFTKKRQVYTVESYLNHFFKESIDYPLVECRHFSVDLENKKIFIKSDTDFLLQEDGTINGSNEKFYYMYVLPIFLLSVKENYNINYDELKEFYDIQKNLSRQKSKKIKSFKILIDYMDKLTKLR